MRPAFAVPRSVAAARAIQERPRSRVVRTGSPGWKLVAGLDATYRGGLGRVAIVAEGVISFPYVPGYLPFREIPPLLAARRKLRSKPDLMIIEGKGLAHPRQLNVARHFGVLLNLPAIGRAKSRLIGTYDEPALARGAWSAIGAAPRTRTGTYVSTGHRIALAAAVRTVLACAPRYRLPEPRRLADQLSKRPWISSASSP